MHKEIFFRVYIARRRDRDVRCFELAFASCAELRCVLSLVARVAAQNGGRSADARHHREGINENFATFLYRSDFAKIKIATTAYNSEPVLTKFV